MSRCDVRKAKPRLQLIVARDMKCSKRTFYHYTGSEWYLWTSQRAADVVYLNFSKAFCTVSHNILVPKFGHYSLDRRTARWVKKKPGWMVGLRGQWSTGHSLPREYEVIAGSTTEVWTCSVDKHVAQIGDRVLSPSLEMAPNQASVNELKCRVATQRSRLVGQMA